MDIYRVTVVPSDNAIVVNGNCLIFNYDFPENIHAIQWMDGKGHIEYTDGSPNRFLTAEDYETELKPFVEAWKVEKARVDEIEAERIAAYNSEDTRAERIRQERDLRILATDYMMLVDFPISADQLEKVKTYRQALRDFPTKEGFPWSGDVNDTTIPWPVLNLE